jgi:CBS domain-containing protein
MQSGVDIPSVLPQDSVATVLARLETAMHPVLPVADHENRLLGVVNLEEIHLASRPGLSGLVVVEDMMRSDIRPLLPTYTLDRALELFIENDLPSLPVVNNSKEKLLIGLLRRRDIASAYLHYIHGPRSPA